MNARGTIVLLVVALALGAWVWLVEIRGGEQKAEAEAAARVIFSLDPASASALELVTSEDSQAVLVREGAGAREAGAVSKPTWKLTAPVAYPADADAVERALRSLEKLASTATIDARPADLEPFGLAAGRKRVAVKAGEGEPRTLYLGGDTPVGAGRYVELASDPNRLFVVSAGSLAGLAPSLAELRDKRLLRLAPDAVDELSVRAGGALVVHARKTEAGWTLVAPESAPADAERIRRVLDDLALGRASGFEDEPKPAKAYGLESPEVEIVARAGDVEERLELGAADSKTWLARAGDPVILEVNERALTSVPRAYFDYRAKRVLTLGVEQLRAIELVYPRSGSTQRLKREGEVWKAEEAGVELQADKVEELAYALEAIDATGLEEASSDRAQIGLEPALATVRAYDEKGALLGELSFGDPHPDRGLPALSSQSPLVWRVTNDLGRELPLSPEAFRNMLVKSAPMPAPAPEPAAEPAAEETEPASP
ncbi:MAG: DUF4340 domain-containing protein [Myxococcota bacterium]